MERFSVTGVEQHGQVTRAMVLAAGKSTRLGGLAAQTPKPMLQLGGRPVLEWTVRRLRAAGIRDLVINLHHAPDVIRSHFGDGARFALHIQYQEEAEPLGTAGAVSRARPLLDDGCPFLIVYGDNVMDWDPAPMLAAHQRHHPIMTIAVAQIPDPSRSGVLQLGEDDAITAFVEKPGNRPELGNWVNAAVYVAEAALFDYLPAAGFCDFGYDVFPALLRRGLPLRAYRLSAPPLAIDTPEQYQVAQQTWRDEAKSSFLESMLR